MPVSVLAEPTESGSSKPACAEIIVVHGIFHLTNQSATRPRTTFSWLRDLFPYNETQTRILTYEYSEKMLLQIGQAIDDSLTNLANSMISELFAHRQQKNALHLPLIFICHGFGGLLVKRAIYWSYLQSGETTKHLQSIYLSTYAVFFASTPHLGIQKAALPLLYAGTNNHPSQFVIELIHGSDFLTEVNDEFGALVRNLCLYNFWELNETTKGGLAAYIVTEASAAPKWYAAERHGIMADHAHMMNFQNPSDPDYIVVLCALQRYIQQSRDVIRKRFDHGQCLDVPKAAASDGMVGHDFEQNIVTGGRVHMGNVIINNALRSDDDLLSVSPMFSQSRRTSRASLSGLNELYIVPRGSSPQFTGRQLQAKIVWENLNRQQDSSKCDRPKIIVLYGLGGSGKTQFCLKYAENNRTSYWGVFWIDASTRENAEAGFAMLGLRAGKGDTFQVGKHWLSQCTQPWLLIIDNVDDPDIEASDYFPTFGNGHIIITTRNPNMIRFANAGHLRFRGMDPEEAVALLLKSAFPQENVVESNPQNRSLARTIASELGFLAIALDQAGRTIHRKIYTLEKYLHFYLGHRYRLVSSSNTISADEANVITTWEIPFQKIEKRKSVEYADAVALMHVFAFLHFETISERIFHASWISNETHSSLPGQVLPGLLMLDSSRTEEAQERLRRAIAVLCDYSIIDHDSNNDSCSLHPVIHRWARTRIPNKEQFGYALYRTIDLLVRCISPFRESSGRSFRRTLLPHVDSCIQILKAYDPNFPKTRQEADQIERFVWLYAEFGFWKSAVSLQQRVIKYRTHTLGTAHEDTLRAQRSLSQMYWDLFEVKSCIEIQGHILKSRWWRRPSLFQWVQFHKPDYVDYCIALDDLTQSLWLAGQRNLSKLTGERAVAGFLKRLGPNDPRTLSAIFNLARTYLHLGELERGHEFIVVVLKMRKRLFGLNHPDTLMTRNELGMSFLLQKKHLAVAESLVTNVLEARKIVLGEEHAYTLWSINDLAKVMSERGKFLQAVKMLEDILPVVERTLGEKHVGVFMTKGNLARAYVSGERWQEAESLLREMLPSITEDHPDWLEYLSGYVLVQIKLGKFEVAEMNCLRMLSKIQEKKLVALSHPRTLKIKEHLETVYSLTRPAKTDER